MALVPNARLGDLGLILDEKPFTLPANAWSDGLNVRFIDGSVYASYGHKSVIGVPMIPAYFLQPTLDVAQTPIFAYCGLAKVYATDQTTHTDITRTVGGDYTGTDADLWNGTNFGGITILNNGVDVPQAWIAPALGTPLVNLANWPSTARAKVMRAFGRYLIGLNITKSGVNYPTLVKWSHQADPGLVPDSWDETDETRDAGEWPLIDTAGPIVEALALSDALIVYKTDAVHSMRYIGGQYIFKFDKLHTDFGALSQRCIGEWRKQHVVISQENVFIFDGFNFKPLLTGKMLRWWSSRIDATNAFRSYLCLNHLENEAWICFPEVGQTFPTLALIVNLLEPAKCTIRELPRLSHIDYNKVSEGMGTTFDDQNIEFDQMVGFYGQTSSTLVRKRMIGVGPDISRNHLLRSNDFTSTWTLTNLTTAASVEIDSETGLGLRKLLPTAANAEHIVSQSFTKSAAQETWVARATVKASGYTVARLRFSTSAGANLGAIEVDLSTGNYTVSNSGNIAGVLGSVEDLGSGVYKITVSATIQTETSVLLELHQKVNLAGSYTFVGDTTSGIHAGVVQVRKGNNVGTFQLTTTVAATSAFFLMDSTYLFDGVPFHTFVERIGLAIESKDWQGTPIVNIASKKFCSELWPKLEIVNAATIQVSVGGQEMTDGPVNYQTAIDFAPSDLLIEPSIEYRLLAVKFEASAGEFWRLTEYDVNVKKIGKF